MASSLRAPSPLSDRPPPAPILLSNTCVFPVSPAALAVRDGGGLCGAMAKRCGWSRGCPSYYPSCGSFFQQAIKDSASLFQLTVKDQETEDEEYVPTPVVVIDQESDPDATVVELSFGDRLGALLDTMKALTDLGLNVVKSRISVEGPATRKRFALTRADTGKKITDPELLEAIRLTIINNMLTYHPESSVQLALGTALGTKSPAKKLDIDISTHIYICDDGPHRSLLFIETADRPGLLRDILKIITDVNISFDSGEFDTEGLVARAKFRVSYRGAALIKPMQEVMTNCLQYFIRRPETNEDSY